MQLQRANRGQVPIDKWFMGLFLLVVLVLAYEFFSPLIDTTLPANLNPSGNAQVASIHSSVSNNFYIAAIILGIGYLFYTFLSGMPGQQEEYPI